MVTISHHNYSHLTALHCPGIHTYTSTSAVMFKPPPLSLFCFKLILLVWTGRTEWNWEQWDEHAARYLAYELASNAQ